MKKIERKKKITKTFWLSCIISLVVNCGIILEIKYKNLGLSSITELSYNQMLLALLEGITNPIAIIVFALCLIIGFISLFSIYYLIPNLSGYFIRHLIPKIIAGIRNLFVKN